MKGKLFPLMDCTAPTSKGSVGTVAVLTGLTFAGSVIIEFLVAVAVSTGLRGGITFKPD